MTTKKTPRESGFQPAEMASAQAEREAAAAKASPRLPGPSLRPIRLCRTATVPLTFFFFFQDQFRAIASSGIELTIASAPGKLLDDFKTRETFAVEAVDMSRQISPWRDLRALMQMIRLFRKGSFTMVHSCTPKAGLLTALAGFVARVPIRMHTFTGQVWMELSGWQRFVSRSCDWLVGRLNTHLYADSPSQMRFLIDNGIVREKTISVIGAGSVSGVDLVRFDPDRPELNQQAKVRAELGIDSDSLVILFVGRITRDKGITELVTAFKRLDLGRRRADLVLVGLMEQVREPLPKFILDEIAQNPRIHVVNFPDAPERYMSIASVFCLPSYREGFGTTVIEAAALGLPTVGTAIVGMRDAIVDERTGILVPPKDPDLLAKGLQRILADQALRERMGREAQERVRREFDAQRVNEMVVAEYWRLYRQVILREEGLQPPTR